MKFFNHKLFLKMVLALIIISACTQKSSDNIPVSYNTVDDLLEGGWEFYRDGYFAEALTNFENAAARNALEIESYIGKGWSNLFLTNYNNAISDFNMVLNLGFETNDSISIADAYAGLFLLNVARRFEMETDPNQNPTDEEISSAIQDALTYGEAALVFSSDYTTEHDPDFTFYELRENLAQIYYFLQRFENCSNHVERMFGIDILESLAAQGLEIIGNDASLSPWVNKDEELQNFNLAEDGSLSSLLLSEGGVIKVTEFLLQNSGQSVLNSQFDYLLEDNQLVMLAEGDFASAVDTVESYKIQHTMPLSGMANFYILALPNSGVYNVESIYEQKNEDEIYWFRVDTTIVVPDTTLADSTYSETDTCCYFYSDTLQVTNYYEVDPANYSVWSTLDDVTPFLPTDPDIIVYPELDSMDYNYNFINLENENNFGDIFVVSYQYGIYSVSYKQTDQYMAYLEFLNSLISSDSSGN